MDAFSHFEKTVAMPVLKQQRTTTPKIDNQVLVNEDMKKKWHEAKYWKERTATLIAVHEMTLHHLNQATNCATGDLVHLVEQYGDLSLAGSCSAQVKSAIRFLEALKDKGGLHHMNRKLTLLNKIEKDIQEGVSG